MKLDSHLISYTKVNSKYIINLNVRASTIKLLEENIALNLHDPELGNGFLDMTPKAQATKKTNKLNFIRIKNICASEDTIKKVKKTPQNRRKYLQITYMIRIYNLHPEYIKNPYNSTKRQINFKMNERNNNEIPHISIRMAKI